MTEEDRKKPSPDKSETDNRPIPRSPLTEMRHREIARDQAIKKRENPRKTEDD